MDSLADQLPELHAHVSVIFEDLLHAVSQACRLQHRTAMFPFMSLLGPRMPDRGSQSLPHLPACNEL